MKVRFADESFQNNYSTASTKNYPSVTFSLLLIKEKLLDDILQICIKKKKRKYSNLKIIQFTQFTIFVPQIKFLTIQIIQFSRFHSIIYIQSSNLT